MLFAIADARLRRGVILAAMLVAGFLSNPLYRSTHLHHSKLYYVAFFLAGFVVVDLHLTRPEGKRSFLWDALASLCGCWCGSWAATTATSYFLL
jgi:hypothetical protein